MYLLTIVETNFALSSSNSHVFSLVFPSYSSIVDQLRLEMIHLTLKEEDKIRIIRSRSCDRPTIHSSKASTIK